MRQQIRGEVPIVLHRSENRYRRVETYAGHTCVYTLAYKERGFKAYSPTLVRKGLGVRSGRIVIHTIENCCKPQGESADLMPNRTKNQIIHILEQLTSDYQTTKSERQQIAANFPASNDEFSVLEKL